nr:unnamed protein product [Callosobruchus chinensis]
MSLSLLVLLQVMTVTRFQMAKANQNSSRELEKRREAKKMSMRRAREKIGNDPVRHAEKKQNIEIVKKAIPIFET